MALVTQCPGCGRRYKVRRAGVTFACKACGEQVRVEDPDAGPADAKYPGAQHACPRCETVVFGAEEWLTHFRLDCIECGQRLGRPSWQAWMSIGCFFGGGGLGFGIFYVLGKLILTADFARQNGGLLFAVAFAFVAGGAMGGAYLAQRRMRKHPTWELR